MHLVNEGSFNINCNLEEIDLGIIMQDGIWVFMVPGAIFPSGTFKELKIAEEWIERHKLTGVLTEYPINIGFYDWAIETGKFRPKPEKEIDSKFIGQFTTALMSYHHYEDGICVG